MRRPFYTGRGLYPVEIFYLATGIIMLLASVIALIFRKGGAP